MKAQNSHNLIKSLSKLFIVLLCCSLVFACDAKYDLLIRNVQVIDIETGQITKQDVFIKDSMIVDLTAAKNGSATSSDEIIDGTGKFLLPGFWDMHVHIQDSLYFSLFLDHGIIGVRDMGGFAKKPTDGCESVGPNRLNVWKDAIKKGAMKGPHLFFAGPTLSGTGWPTSLPVNSRSEVQNAFKTSLQNKVDFIKVYEQIPKESYFEIAKLARENNLDFAGHTSETMLLSEIVELGQKSIEHLREPILYCFTDDTDELEAFMQADSYSEEDRQLVAPWIKDANKALAKMKKNRTWFTPTMAIQYARRRQADTLWIKNRLRGLLPKSVNVGFRKHMQRMHENEDKKGDSLWWEAHKKLVKRLNDKGIGLLAGSDSACEGGIPGFSLHEELQLMVEEAGLSPLEALKTACINPCIYFGFKKRGKVAKLFYADLVLLNENPLENIRNTLTLKVVIKNGLVERVNHHPKND